MTELELAKNIRKLFETDEHFCQKMYAASPDGRQKYIEDASLETDCFCIRGAAIKLARLNVNTVKPINGIETLIVEPNSDNEVHIHLLNRCDKVSKELFGRWVMDVNDELGLEAVKSVLDNVIAELEVKNG